MQLHSLAHTFGPNVLQVNDRHGWQAPGVVEVRWMAMTHRACSQNQSWLCGRSPCRYSPTRTATYSAAGCCHRWTSGAAPLLRGWLKEGGDGCSHGDDLSLPGL